MLKLIPIFISSVLPGGDDNNSSNSGGISPSGGDKRRLSMGRVYAVGTLLAVIIAVPASVVAAVMHFVIRTDVTLTLMGSLIAFFMAVAVGYKISKKFVKVPQK